MIKIFAIAGALGVLSTVAVYEGKSVFGRARSAHRPAAHAHTTSQGDEDRPRTAVDDMRQSLADSLIRCEDRLAQREREQPNDANAAVEVEHVDNVPAPAEPIHGFEPTGTEWRELAQQGVVKLNRPCLMSKGWTPAESDLKAVGLEARDGQAVAEAYHAANARSWETTRVTCAEVLGADAAVVERIGPEYCQALLDAEARKHSDVFRHVAEIRAGTRAEASAQQMPLEGYFLAKTRELNDFEADLARRVGKDGARRITGSDVFCTLREQWPENRD
ncbi:hypothetical protein LVJ94_45155 [Pendulispora rubella]|uniref:Uncharacterized protein n=1 Tax=Pendulispora rubella TaxID=2741070 RepID=A0ABZ2KZH4_9BACT